MPLKSRARRHPAPEPCQLRQRARRRPRPPAKPVIFNFTASIPAASRGRRGVIRGAGTVRLLQIFLQNPNAVGLQSCRIMVGREERVRGRKAGVGGEAFCPASQEDPGKGGRRPAWLRHGAAQP